jgi:hypothetical protein
MLAACSGKALLNAVRTLREGALAASDLVTSIDRTCFPAALLHGALTLLTGGITKYYCIINYDEKIGGLKRFAVSRCASSKTGQSHFILQASGFLRKSKQPSEMSGAKLQPCLRAKAPLVLSVLMGRPGREREG